MRKYIIGLLICVSVLSTGASTTNAQSMDLAQLVNLFISLGIIAPDKAAAARAAVGNANTNTNTSITGFCHSWNSNLTIGTNTDDVGYLRGALKREGLTNSLLDGPFDEELAAAVVKFQSKYSLPQTGYVGALTRVKLNALYGCDGDIRAINSRTPIVVPPTPDYKYIPTQPVSPTPSTAQPTLSYITPTSVKTGATVWVHGTNFNSNTYVSIDGIYGKMVWPNNAPATGSGTFSITIPSNLNTGNHTIQVMEKGSSFPATKTVTLVIDTDVPPVSIDEPSVSVVTPNGGETYVAGSSNIHISFKTSSISGQLLTAYLYSPTLGNVRSISTNADYGSTDLNLTKGDSMDQPGQYKINLCALNVDGKISGKPLCDSSDNYFTITPSPTVNIPAKTLFTEPTMVSIDPVSLYIHPNAPFTLSGNTTARNGTLTIAITDPNYSGSTDWNNVSQSSKDATYRTISPDGTRHWTASFIGFPYEGAWKIFIYDNAYQLIGTETLHVSFKG